MKAIDTEIAAKNTKFEELKKLRQQELDAWDDRKRVQQGEANTKAATRKSKETQRKVTRSCWAPNILHLVMQGVHA